MITRMGFLRLEGGAWFNLRHIKLLRIFVDASTGEWRIECLDHAEQGWLMEHVWDSQEEAELAMDGFFDYFGPGQETPPCPY